MKQVFRLDYGQFDGTSRTPSGGFRLDAFVTRVGIFEYLNDTGEAIRELRHPEEVFHVDSMASLEDAPLTVRHPGRVTPSDYCSHAVGYVRDVKKNGIFVQARAIIQDAKAIEGIGKDLVEVSCGYSCTIDPTPGMYNGEHYDSRQTHIRYNHVALGPKGWGRAGSSVALRLDSGDAIQSLDTSVSKDLITTKEFPMLVNIAGKPFTVGTPEHVAALTEFAAAETDRADTAVAALAEATAKASEATGRADAADKALAQATDPTTVSAMVNSRLSLQKTAGSVLGDEFKYDGLSDVEIMVAAITKCDPSFKSDGLDNNYILGRFSGVKPTKQTDAVGVVRAAVKAAVSAESPKTFEQKRADALAESQNAWTKPLSATKK